MSNSNKFIEREVFDKMMKEVKRSDGGSYQDVNTIYGDMSRLVVGWLAKTSPAELDALYRELGWNGESQRRSNPQGCKSLDGKAPPRRLATNQADHDPVWVNVTQ